MTNYRNPFFIAFIPGFLFLVSAIGVSVYKDSTAIDLYVKIGFGLMLIFAARNYRAKQITYDNVAFFLSLLFMMSSSLAFFKALYI